MPNIKYNIYKEVGGLKIHIQRTLGVISQCDLCQEMGINTQW